MFSFQFPGSQMPYINALIRQGAESSISDSEFIIREIKEFMASPKRADMIKGINYYRGIHDILKRKRTVIGEEGKPQVVENIPNNRIINNQYRKMVEQKSNYILGKPFAVNCENREYSDLLKAVFGRGFQRTLKGICEDSLNCGIGWLYIYYDERGELAFKRLRPWEIIPGWSDEEHKELSYAIRVYDVVLYEGKKRKVITKAEVFDSKGIKRFIVDGSRLIPDGTEWKTPYFYRGDKGFNWDKIPLIPFKYNDSEIPLIKFVKSLQDGLNLMISNYENAMEEEPRNTILVLKNYDGENLGEFRKNLAEYGAVKVRNADGSNGGVDTLSVEVNSDNYSVIIDILKKAIIENAMGYDAKDDRLGANANKMNIQSMYSDIDLDANGMETEYQAAFEKIIWFVNAHFENRGKGSFEGERAEIIFNRDILINESEVIENCVKSKGIISDETIVAQHPWIEDVKGEMERMKNNFLKESV